MKLVDCKTMLVPEDRLPIIDAILNESKMRILQIPKLDELLEHTHPNYPFHKSFQDAQNEPLVVLHTSGTTGLPKPIIWTHAWAASFGEQRLLTPPPGFELSDAMLLKTRILSLMPPFHVSHSLFHTYGVHFPAVYRYLDIMLILTGCTFVCQHPFSYPLRNSSHLPFIRCPSFRSIGCGMSQVHQSDCINSRTSIRRGNWPKPRTVGKPFYKDRLHLLGRWGYLARHGRRSSSQNQAFYDLRIY